MSRRNFPAGFFYVLRQTRGQNAGNFVSLFLIKPSAYSLRQVLWLIESNSGCMIIKHGIMKKITGFLLLLLQLTACVQASRIDLAGRWTVRLDSADAGMDGAWYGKLYDTPITLPGTTDMAGLGIPSSLEPALAKPQMLRLTRAYSYIGPAWYSREVEIPAEWEGKELFLHLERVLWDSQVWVDGVLVDGHEESLTTPIATILLLTFPRLDGTFLPSA